MVALPEKVNKSKAVLNSDYLLAFFFSIPALPETSQVHATKCQKWKTFWSQKENFGS